MVRKLLLASVLLALVGGAAWWCWRWYTTPVPPVVPLEGLDRELAAAIEKSLEEVRRQPRSGKTWGELSRLLIANGLNEPALPCLVQVQRLDPGQACWPYLHGSVLLLLSRPQEAIPKLRQALDLTQDPKERQAITFVLAQGFLDSAQLDEAEQQLRSLGQLEGDSSRVHLGLGLLALAREDRSGAQEHLRRLAEHPCARKQVCSILARLVREDEKRAKHYGELAAQLPPDLPWPNRFDADVREYRVTPTQPLERYTMEMAAGRRAEAVAYLRQVAAQSPDEAICFTLGFALVRDGEFEEAEKYLRQVLGMNPRHLKAHVFLGAALLERGEKRSREPGGTGPAKELFRQALQAEDAALGIQNDVALAHLIRGRALKHLDRAEEAVASLRRAVLIGPDLAEAHQALGETLAELGQLKAGLKHLEDATRVAPPEDPRPRQALEKWRAKAKTAP